MARKILAIRTVDEELFVGGACDLIHGEVGGRITDIEYCRDGLIGVNPGESSTYKIIVERIINEEKEIIVKIIPYREIKCIEYAELVLSKEEKVVSPRAAD